MNKLLGPFKLTEKSIDDYIMPSIPGPFVLGELKDNEFKPQFIGRADECLNYRLKGWVGKYSYFKCGYTLTLRESFDKQCRIYHEVLETGALANDSHPQPPEGQDLKCPYCNP